MREEMFSMPHFHSILSDSAMGEGAVTDEVSTHAREPFSDPSSSCPAGCHRRETRGEPGVSTVATTSTDLAGSAASTKVTDSAYEPIASLRSCLLKVAVVRAEEVSFSRYLRGKDYTMGVSGGEGGGMCTRALGGEAAAPSPI
jgi:hypothetical protein